MMRNALSVLAGFALWSALWLISNAAATALVPEAYNEDGMTDSAPLLLVFLALSFVISVGSGFLTAVIGPAEGMKPVWALGVFLLAFGLFVQIQLWDVMPLWYHIPFLVLLVPGVLAGAQLRRRRMSES